MQMKAPAVCCVGFVYVSMKNNLRIVDPPVDSHFCSPAYYASFVEQPENFHFSNCFSLAYIGKDIAILIVKLTRLV